MRLVSLSATEVPFDPGEHSVEARAIPDVKASDAW